ncbi:unnamed protein product [Nezara viridula]|uniref:Uncharacterized protein n=1 Tax=Nezara viridula TaxID=85310 RepID=A0A9P0E5V4_NEZVI|nr:unnamed protein product [Nezara viridula]
MKVLEDIALDGQTSSQLQRRILQLAATSINSEFIHPGAAISLLLVRTRRRRTSSDLSRIVANNSSILTYGEFSRDLGIKKSLHRICLARPTYFVRIFSTGIIWQWT